MGSRDLQQLAPGSLGRDSPNSQPTPDARNEETVNLVSVFETEARVKYSTVVVAHGDSSRTNIQ